METGPIQEDVQYEALLTPTAINPAPLDAGIVQIDIDQAPKVEEAWTHTSTLGKFTIEDAKALEWDYANVTKKDFQRDQLRYSVRMSSKSFCPAPSSACMSSEFGDHERETKEELGVLLDPYYDVTTGRLRRMFKHFSPQGKDTVSYDEFQNGLLVLGISVPANVSFRDLVRKVDTNGDGTISFNEFVTVVRMIKQAHLFKPEHIEMVQHVLRVVDYSPTNLHAVNPVTKPQSFMFSSKPAWAKVRWVHLAGFRKQDDLNMRRLAIKYQLHPLALEDCLNQSDKIRCKYEHYEDHSFLVLPVIRAQSIEKRHVIETCIADHRRSMFTKRQALMKEEPLDTPPLSKADLVARLNELKVMMREPEQLCIFSNKEEVLSVQEEVDTDTSAFPLWDAVFDHNMSKSYSKLRSHGAGFLVISLLNATLEEIFPLVEVFEAKFELLGQLLRIEGIKFDTKRFSRSKKQLIAIEKIVRPLVDLVQDQLLDQEEFNQGEVKNYLRDVKDHIKQMATELREHQQTLNGLIEEDKQIRAQSQADVMYAMSVFAACFLPGTFMTGVYGMNFDNMPELGKRKEGDLDMSVSIGISTPLDEYRRREMPCMPRTPRSNVIETWEPIPLLPRISIQDVGNLEWNFSREACKLHPHHRYEMDEMEEELHVLLDPFYDVSSGRMHRMFQHFISNEDNGVTYNAFEEGLAALGISSHDKHFFGEFIRKIDTDNDGFINVDEFIKVVQLIKLAHLLRTEIHQDIKYILRVIDYSPSRLHVVSPVQNLEGFMFSAIPSWASVRWIHLCGFQKPDDINLRRLAIKYQLHPLAVEDCVNADGRIRCKYEEYDDHSFLILPIIRPLDSAKRAHINACIRDRRETLFQKDQTLHDASIQGTEHNTTKKQTKNPKGKQIDLHRKLQSLHVLMRQPQQLCLFISKDNSLVISIQEEMDTSHAVLPLWHLVYSYHLTKSYTKVRNHNGNFLVVSILNALVDEMMPLVHVFDAMLKMIGKLVRIDGIRFKTKRFSRIKKQLLGIERIVHPMLDLVQNQLYEEDSFSHGEVKKYLRDVRDHLKQMANDIQRHHTTLGALVEMEKEIRAQHQANIMYIMSVAAACFLPGTFMTGIYGMNFDNMPELHTESGYFISLFGGCMKGCKIGAMEGKRKPQLPMVVLPHTTETWDPPRLSIDHINQLEWNYSSAPESFVSYGTEHVKEALHVLLDPFYDVTSGRLRRMFKHFCTEEGQDGGVTYEDFERGLTELGIAAPPTMDFRSFTRAVDVDNDGYISLGEFVHVVQLIKQAHLFKPIANEAFGNSTHYILRVADYASGNLRAATPVRDLQGFMFSQKPKWAAVRWVHLSGFTKPDDLTIRRLAIKFQLHPLAIEDCVNADEKVRCKYEHFQDHAFLVLPVIRPLDLGKRKNMEHCILERRKTMQIKDQMLCAATVRSSSFLETSPRRKRRGDDGKRREELKAKLNSLHVLMRSPQQLCLFISRDKGHVISVQEEVDDTNSVLPLWRLVYEQHLTKSYSKVRNHKASFLVVSIINATVDEMLPLVAVFDATLKMLAKLLRLDGIQFNTKRFTRVKKQLIAIEKVVRPMLDLVQDQLLDEEEFNHGEVKNYLRGVKDHLKQMAIDLKDHQQTLAALVEEEKQIHAQHQANVMYIMSVVAACFLPGTFMTGVYGMNFDYMPELHVTYGYFVWWGVLGVIVFTLLGFLKLYKQWI